LICTLDLKYLEIFDENDTRDDERIEIVCFAGSAKMMKSKVKFR
jgi:hypothetical protein